MPRSIPGAWSLTADRTRLALCVQIVDRLGTVYGFTEHNNPLDIDIADGKGAVTYRPSAAFVRALYETRAAGQVGTLDFVGMLDDAGVPKNLIYAKVFDSAAMRIFMVDWEQPGAGIAWIDIGEIEASQVSGRQIQFTFKSLLDRYSAIEFGDVFSVDCIHSLGSQPDDIPPPFGRIGCQVQLQPPLWQAGLQVVAREDRSGKPPADGSPTQVNTVRPTTPNGRYFEARTGGTTGGSEPAWTLTLDGTTSDNGVTWVTRQALSDAAAVSSVADQSTLLLDYAGDAEDQWFRRGRIVFTSGANVGLGRQIKTAALGSPADGTLLVSTWTPFPFAIDVSPADTVEIVAGCDRKLATCKDKFRNLRNFGGFAVFAPNRDSWFAIPRE